MKLPLLGQVLECLGTNDKVTIVDESEGSISGSASALYDIVGQVKLNRSVYGISFKENEFILSLE